MKRKTSLLALLSFIIVLTLLLSCCDSKSFIDSSSNPENESSYKQKIEILESQVLLLMQKYELSESEYKLHLSKLQEEIINLKELTSDTSDNKSEDPSSPPPTNGNANINTEDISPFTYTVSDDKAIITGYTGQDERLVIPTSIDGYTVIEIADSAIKSSTIKDVIISTSVIKIGWFAFSNCTKLKTITIPQNVEKIGYSAFGNSNEAITIYCYDNSFAQSYAKSYGFAYKLL